MKVLLIGASSYLGARIYYDLRHVFSVVGTYSSNRLASILIHLDITNTDQIGQVMYQIKPDIIIHSGNIANSRWCEDNPDKAKAINTEATEVIVKHANTLNSSLIYISSFTAAKPTSVYSQSKQISEEIVKDTMDSWLIIRPSLIIGYSPNTKNDRPFNRLLNNIDNNTPAVYDNYWKFYPTYIGHISEVVTYAIQNNFFNYTVPVAIDELKSRYDIARDILGPYGIKTKPMDSKDDSPIITQDVSMMRSFGVSPYTYSGVIRRIHEEINNRNLYIL